MSNVTKFKVLSGTTENVLAEAEAEHGNFDAMKEWAKENGCVAYGMVGVASDGGWYSDWASNSGVANLAFFGAVAAWLNEILAAHVERTSVEVDE